MADSLLSDSFRGDVFADPNSRLGGVWFATSPTINA